MTHSTTPDSPSRRSDDGGRRRQRYRRSRSRSPRRRSRTRERRRARDGSSSSPEVVHHTDRRSHRHGSPVAVKQEQTDDDTHIRNGTNVAVRNDRDLMRLAKRKEHQSWQADTSRDRCDLPSRRGGFGSGAHTVHNVDDDGADNRHEYMASRRAQDEQRSQYYASRRTRRVDISDQGVTRAWSSSPQPPRNDNDIMAVRTDDEDDVKAAAAAAAADRDDEKSERKKKDKKKHKHKKHKKNKVKSEVASESEKSDEEDEWIEITKETLQQRNLLLGESDEEAEVIGPKLPTANDVAAGGPAQLKSLRGLRPGEAAKMAAYAAEGKRIPRRGEIGVSGDDIVNYEKMGYVMSGSRHQGMEASRLRKESQIYSAEEKRMLSMLSVDERKKKEEQILDQFKKLVQIKMQKSSHEAHGL